MPLIEKEVIAPGSYWYVDQKSGLPRKLDVTPELTKYWQEQGNKMLATGLTVPVPCEHDFSAHPMTPREKLLNNAGWVREYVVKDTEDGRKNVLFAATDILDEEVYKKLPNTIKYTSPWINSFTDGNGNQWNNVISHLALTLRPRITQQSPFPSIAAALSMASEWQHSNDNPISQEGFFLSRAFSLIKEDGLLKPQYPMAFSLFSGIMLTTDKHGREHAPAGSSKGGQFVRILPDVGKHIAESESLILAPLRILYKASRAAHTAGQKVVRDIAKEVGGEEHAERVGKVCGVIDSVIRLSNMAGGAGMPPIPTASLIYTAYKATHRPFTTFKAASGFIGTAWRYMKTGKEEKGAETELVLSNEGSDNKKPFTLSPEDTKLLVQAMDSSSNPDWYTALFINAMLKTKNNVKQSIKLVNVVIKKKPEPPESSDEQEKSTANEMKKQVAQGMKEKGKAMSVEPINAAFGDNPPPKKPPMKSKGGDKSSGGDDDFSDFNLNDGSGDDKPGGDTPKDGDPTNDDQVDLPPLGSKQGDVSMSEVLCDLLRALGVNVELTEDEGQFKRNLYAAAMQKVHELTNKGMNKEEEPKPGAINQGKPPGSPGANNNPIVQQEQQPMYMSLEEIHKISDPTMKTIALSMYNENVKLQAKLEANEKTANSLRDARLKEANLLRNQRVAMISKVSPKVKSDLEAVLALPDMALSMGDGGDVVDPLAQTLTMLEKQATDLPKLLTTPSSALSTLPHPTDQDTLTQEEEDRIVDSLSRMAGAPPVAKKAS